MDAGGRVLACDGLSFVAQGVTTYGATGLAAAGETLGTQYPGTLDDTSRLVVSTMSGAGAIRSTTISGLHGFGVFALAGDPQGNVALLVFNTRERIVYLRRKGSSTFTKVLTIKVSDQARGATLAVGGRSGGELLVAYEDHHTLYARHRGTRSWGSVHQLGDGVQSDISAAFDGSGRESVAWKSQRISEGESNTPAIVSFTTAAPGKGFGARRPIESVSGPGGAGHYVSSPAVLLRVVDSTHTLLAWTGSRRPALRRQGRDDRLRPHRDAHDAVARRQRRGPRRRRGRAVRRRARPLALEHRRRRHDGRHLAARHRRLPRARRRRVRRGRAGQRGRRPARRSLTGLVDPRDRPRDRRLGTGVQRPVQFAARPAN